MSATTNFNMNMKKSELINDDSCEYNTYYPSFYNGCQTKTTTTTMNNNKSMFGSQSMSNLDEELEINTMRQHPKSEDIVISGMSGRFPESDNIEEFADNLYNGVDMVNETERRWPSGLYGLPKRNGTLKDISRFDSEVFGIHAKQVENMDPQSRLLLEVTYEAIFDSGVNPSELRGSRTGVFVGASGSDAQQAFSNQPESLSGYSMTGCAQSMLANRISYCFDFKGPSMVVDTACSSSLVALDAAITAIRTNQCDCAIVGGVNILSRPQTSLQFQRLGMLSPDGKCQSFDAKGQGYVRSETVGAVFITKKSLCKRFYAKVLHSKINTDGAKEQGITFPNGQVQARLLREIYAECNIDPSLVTYVEAHGTGTKAGDPQELNAIADVFASCQRTVPLFVGSTKSNMGHSEPASGIASLIKMLIAIQRGIIPSNLHYQEPNAEVSALVDGRMTVVKSNTKFQGGLMALNSFGFGGSNAHILLQPNCDYYSSKTSSLWRQDLSEITTSPRLFQFCARTEEGLNKVFDHMHENTYDLAKQVLLQSQTTSSPVTYPYRGWTMLNSKQQEQQRVQQIKRCDNEKRPIYYIFSGMGSQFTGMGQDLMKIDCFRQSIIRSSRVLKRFDIDLMDLIYAKHNVYTRPLNSFVCIAAIQIALVDCLKRANIEADGMIGHSVGELACAYADNCMTAEETLLCAYWRGKVIEEAQLPMGAMAVVGMTWSECQRRCPMGVVPACHNSTDSVTVSGPKAAVCEFVEQMKAEGIFAKEVDSSNVAFHSQHMTSLAPTLKYALESVISAPKMRSQKWISTSVPESKWSTDSALYSSADYHVNNFCSPVLFQQGLQHIPSNAICIEIAPHALLQSIIRRSLPTTIVSIPLCKKDTPCLLEHFWSQLGQLYLAGCNLDSVKLMVPCGFEYSMYPVPVRTGCLSHLVQWNHEQKWNVPSYEDFTMIDRQHSKNTLNNTFTHSFDLNGEDSYLTGHQIDGRAIYPATGYLYLVWETFASMKGLKIEDCPIRFENVEIFNAKFMDIKDKSGLYRPIDFVCTISPATGSWEIFDQDKKCIASGLCFTSDEQLITFNAHASNLSSYKRCEILQKNEIYRELALRGYQYTKEFQSIVQCNLEGSEGKIMWTGKWIPFLDSMLQMSVLSKKSGLLLPTRIRSITIDPKIHMQRMSEMTTKMSPTEEFNTYDEYFNTQSKYNTEMRRTMSTPVMTMSSTSTFPILPAQYDEYTNTIMCGGVEICGLHATWAPKKQWTQPAVLERVNFVPYVENTMESLSSSFFNEEQPCRVHNVKNCPICRNLQRFEYSKESSPTYFKKMLHDFYLEECHRYCSHILSKIQNPMTTCQTIESRQVPKECLHYQQQYYSKLFTTKDSLLDMLKRCSSMDSTDCQYFYNVQKMFSNNCQYFKSLQQDMVMSCSNERINFLKNFMDIVMENKKGMATESRPIRVLEISPSMGYFFGEKLSKLMKSYPQTSQMEYHYVSLTVDNETTTTTTTESFKRQQDEDMWNEYCSIAHQQSTAVTMKKSQWNISLSKGLLNCELPKNLKDFDCVILNGCLSTILPFCQSESELKFWLNKSIIEQAMCPSGFVMVHEHTGNFEVLKQLNMLEKTIFRQQYPSSSINTTKFMTEQNWRQIIEESYLKPVSLKSDNILSTFFLYRKPFSPSSSSSMRSMEMEEEKICIDDIAEYQWIEKVKTALNKSDCQRVWLVSEKTPSSGIVGLVNCMRREIGGDKIRCIFMTDNKPIDMYSWLVPTTTTTYSTPSMESNIQKRNVKWTELFDQLRQADMVMNVFRSGKWGSFRHCLDCMNNFDDFSSSSLISTERQFNDQYLKSADYYPKQQQQRTLLHTCTVQCTVPCKIQICQRNDLFKQMQPKKMNMFINCLTRGDLSSLQWIQSPEFLTTPRSCLSKERKQSSSFGPEYTKKATCQVSYAALNFRDIMLATGKLSPEAIPGYQQMQNSLLGMEFSGTYSSPILKTQKRVMGIVQSMGLATSVACNPKYLWDIPREWTLEEAATVPIAYSTAYYSLCVRGDLKQYESVLIHAGSGAVGQAAIAIALSKKCRVFVTVSTEEKRDYLKSIFPQLTDDCFFNSRDCEFERQIMRMTQGKGVDCILNCLSDKKLQASVRVLAQHGRFLEIGKFDLNRNSNLGMNVFLKNTSFNGILVDSLFNANSKEWRMVYQLVEEGIRSGVVRPLKSTVFEMDQIEKAFRFMAQGKHIGKVLIKINDFETQFEKMSLKMNNHSTSQYYSPSSTTTTTTMTSDYCMPMPKVWFSPLKSYIVTGGLGGFGLELCQWMVERGARFISLTSRSGVKTGYQTRKIQYLQQEFGATINVTLYDVANEYQCMNLFKECADMCPSKQIGGVFHLAGIVEDSLFDNQTIDSFRNVNEIKYKGTYNLDKCSRMNNWMDDSALFLVWSSIVAGRGNMGQTNYGFANSAMERICEQRLFDGKHALAIQWGAIADVGMIVESIVFNGSNDTIVGGTMPQRIQSCLSMLELLLAKNKTPTTSTTSTYEREYPSSSSAIWSSYVPCERRQQQTETFLHKTTTSQNKSVIESIANIMGLKDISLWRNETTTLAELGLDSLMNVEIKQVLEQLYNIPMSMKEIQQLTLEKLRLLERSSTQKDTFQNQPQHHQLKHFESKRIQKLMPTRCIEKLNEIEYIPSQTLPIFTIHPIEGHTNMLKEFAQYMKYPTFGCQFTKECTHMETIEQLADYYWQQIDRELAKYGTTQMIHLCGYSFGGSVAFEMAAKRPNRIASMTFLDGSHSFASSQISSYRNKFIIDNDMHETECEALFTFMQQYTNMHTREFILSELRRLPTLEQKIKFVVHELTSTTTSSLFNFESEDLEQAARAYVKKLFMSFKYAPKCTLRMRECLLIKSSKQTEMMRQTLGYDYGLSTVMTGKINVETIKGDHQSFLQSQSALQVATCMNQYLQGF